MLHYWLKVKMRSFFDIPIPQLMRITISMKKGKFKGVLKVETTVMGEELEGYQDQCIASGPLRMGNQERDATWTHLLACHKAHKRIYVCRYRHIHFLVLGCEDYLLEEAKR